MRPALAVVSVVAAACATEETPLETWVVAEVNGDHYSGHDEGGTLFEDLCPNHLQLWSDDQMAAVLFDWPVGAPRTWALGPPGGWGVPNLYWYDMDVSTWAWISTSGTFEIATFEANPEHSAEDLRLGWIGGTFEAVLENLLGGPTVTITNGMFRALVTRPEGVLDTASPEDA